MNYRKLRIAWSVFWGVAAVLVVVFWFRSYRPGNEFDIGGDHCSKADSQRQLYSVYSYGGIIQLALTYPAPSGGWRTRGGEPVLGFSAHSDATSTTVTLPHWFLFLFAATLSASTYIRWSKRFSLRTLLIAATLMVVVLELIVLSFKE